MQSPASHYFIPKCSFVCQHRKSRLQSNLKKRSILVEETRETQAPFDLRIPVILTESRVYELKESLSMNWNQETKTRLNEKVAQNVQDVGSLVRHVVKTSRSSELLAQAAKNFSCQENVIHNSSESLKKMVTIKTQLEYQESAIERSMSTLSDIQEQLNSINR